MKTNRRRSYTPNPVCIDGPSRSGKGAVSVAVSSLDRTEHITTILNIDRMITFYSLGLIDRDVTIDSIATEVDLRLWKNYLGRDLNTNIHDLTSVLNSRDPDMYKKRMENHDTEKSFMYFLNQIQEEQPISLLCTDELLLESDIIIEALNNLKIIVVLRHPIDLAFAWHRSGRGHRYGTDPRMIHPTFSVNNRQPIPALAVSWAEDYINMNPIDRAVASSIYLNNRYLDFLENIPEIATDKVYIVSFEKFVTNPNPILKDICEFLDTKITTKTQKMLNRARVPRLLNVDDFSTKFHGIKANCSESVFSKIQEGSIRYENLFQSKLRISNIGQAGEQEYPSDFNTYFRKPKYLKGKRIN